MDDDCQAGVISDEMVESQIDVMNEDFLALTDTLGENGTNVMFQFCLAGLDRTCNSSYFGDTPGFKEALNVNPGNFLNIYTNNTGWLGYATWPWSDGGLPHDGVVIRWSAFGRNSPLPRYDLGRTGTHEVGHYLGLLHTFEGGCGSSTEPGCYSDGDRICDTNPEAADHYGCTQTYSCDATLADPIHNYMNYTDDLCMTEFTIEQAQRLVCILENYRTTFLTSGCTTPPIAVCRDVTVPTDTGVCHADAFVDNGSYHPNGVPVMLSQSPTGPYSLGVTNVSLTVTDSNSLSSSCTANITVNDPENPSIACPSDTTIECGESTDPSNTGTPSATDNCGSVTVQRSDAISSVSCGYTITRTWTATDASANSVSCVQSIDVEDTTPPALVGVPADETIECGATVPPPAVVTATDNCDTSVDPSFNETPVAGNCAGNYTLTRTWTAVDDCVNTSIGSQTITVQDTVGPIISCNNPTTMTPPNAPTAFKATATDNCSGATTRITGYNCVAKKSKLSSCVVSISGDTITILNSGGVGDKIAWTVQSVDGCSNTTNKSCSINVVNPKKQ
jgi:hypothetical protein